MRDFIHHNFFTFLLNLAIDDDEDIIGAFTVVIILPFAP